MKNLILCLLSVAALSCNKDDSSVSPPSQNISLLISPSQTDSNYQLGENSHYVVRNNNTHVNKMLLFIGGSYSSPQDYTIFCSHAATIGLDVVSLSYPNLIATAPLGASSDPLIFDNYRDELCYGNAVSAAVDVDALNAINTRAIKLVQFLKNSYPDQNWGQYLTTSNTLKWDKIIVAGHSQGSGHACYLAKQNLVDRVVMFSGPNDYSTYFNSPANWLTQNGVTPVNKHFSLLHVADEIVPFAYQVDNLRGLGLLTDAQNPTLVDNLAAPFSNAQSLSINIAALSNHNSTVGGNTILPDIWTYMLLE